MVYCRDHNKGKEEKAKRDGKTEEEEKERTPEKEIKEKKKHSHSFMKRNKDAIPKVINFIAASCKLIKKNLNKYNRTKNSKDVLLPIFKTK